MGCPTATWNDFSTHNIQKDVMLKVCSNFLQDVEQIRMESATMRQEMWNLQKNFKNTELIACQEILDFGLPPKRETKKLSGSVTIFYKNGHTPKWCRKTMRDEGIRRVQHDKSLNKNIAPIREYGTSDSNCRSQHHQYVDQCPDSDDVKIPSNNLLTTEEEASQDESNDLTPLEPKFISTTNGMSFNTAQITSTGESDDEQSNPLPMGF